MALAAVRALPDPFPGEVIVHDSSTKPIFGVSYVYDGHWLGKTSLLMAGPFPMHAVRLEQVLHATQSHEEKRVKEEKRGMGLSPL